MVVRLFTMSCSHTRPESTEAEIGGSFATGHENIVATRQDVFDEGDHSVTFEATTAESLIRNCSPLVQEARPKVNIAKVKKQNEGTPPFRLAMGMYSVSRPPS